MKISISRVSDHENTNISLDVHGNGEWDFDYCDNETGGNEQCLINLLPGYFLNSTEMDEDGDRTFFGRYPLTPNLLVRANWDTLDIYEYAAGVELSLNIYDHQPLEEPIYSATLSGTVTTPWDRTGLGYHWTYLVFLTFNPARSSRWMMEFERNPS